MRSMNVRLPEGVAERLQELARRELRGTREQAVWLIVDGLRRAGLSEGRSAEAAGMAHKSEART